jgi:hypothetical protein
MTNSKSIVGLIGSTLIALAISEALNLHIEARLTFDANQKPKENLTQVDVGTVYPSS